MNNVSLRASRKHDYRPRHSSSFLNPLLLSEKRELQFVEYSEKECKSVSFRKVVYARHLDPRG